LASSVWVSISALALALIDTWHDIGSKILAYSLIREFKPKGTGRHSLQKWYSYPRLESDIVCLLRPLLPQECRPLLFYRRSRPRRTTYKWLTLSNSKSSCSGECVEGFREWGALVGDPGAYEASRPRCTK